MSDFQRVCKVTDVKEGEGRTVEVDKKLIAIFLHEGQYYAIDDVCPHMGASLSGGGRSTGEAVAAEGARPCSRARGGAYRKTGSELSS